jgi:hypothetical protein
MAMIETNRAEPPSWVRPPLFMLGQDLRRNWVVQEQKGGRGGLFVGREAALRFIRAESGYRPQAVVMVSGILELDAGCKGNVVAGSVVASNSQPLRRIA